MENNNGSEGAVKHITLGLILSWILGVLGVVAGLGFAVTSIGAGLVVLLGGLIMLPPVNDVLSKKFRIRLSGGLRFIIAIILLAIGIGMVNDKIANLAGNNNAAAGTQSVSADATTPTNKEQLELVSYSCSRDYGYFKITGQVKNISGESMKSVVAVGSIYTKDGTFVKSDDALIEYNPILPGQTSPFEVTTTDNPAASKCQIAFKEFFGGTIPTKVPAPTK